MNEVFTATSNISLSLIMNFILEPPSLKHRALVAIVVTLWNQKDVKALLAKHTKAKRIRFQNNVINAEGWETIEERVIQKVQQLSLPRLLEEMLLGLIKPTGSQIKDWIDVHFTEFHLRVGLPAEFIWTAHGTIDRKRTVELLIKDETLDLSIRYRLACRYCLEDAVKQFWNNMPRALKEYDWESECSTISFWSHTMKRRLANAHTWKDLFNDCAQEGNKTACEYFFQKLTPRERRESLVQTAICVSKRYSDVFCFLLSKMDVEQQMEVYKHDPRGVCRAVLQWPWQRFFIGIARCIWDFLSKEDYEDMFMGIVSRVKDGYKDFNYQELFKQLWQESPIILKSLIKNKGDQSPLLWSLFYDRDTENIRLILKDATLTEKKKIIYSFYVTHAFNNCIRVKAWDFIKFCIRECLPSKDEMLKFKAAFEKRAMSSGAREHLVKNRRRWKELFCFSDDSVCEYEERSIDEGESSSSKRCCSLK